MNQQMPHLTPETLLQLTTLSALVLGTSLFLMLKFRARFKRQKKISRYYELMSDGAVGSAMHYCNENPHILAEIKTHLERNIKHWILRRLRHAPFTENVCDELVQFIEDFKRKRFDTQDPFFRGLCEAIDNGIHSGFSTAMESKERPIENVLIEVHNHAVKNSKPHTSTYMHCVLGKNVLERPQLLAVA
jgi:hypothetical protein